MAIRVGATKRDTARVQAKVEFVTAEPGLKGRGNEEREEKSAGGKKKAEGGTQGQNKDKDERMRTLRTRTRRGDGLRSKHPERLSLGEQNDARNVGGRLKTKLLGEGGIGVTAKKPGHCSERRGAQIAFWTSRKRFYDK